MDKPSTWTRKPGYEVKASVVFLLYHEAWYKLHLFPSYQGTIEEGVLVSFWATLVPVDHPGQQITAWDPRRLDQKLLRTYTSDDPIHCQLLKLMDQAEHSFNERCPYTKKVKEHLLTYQEEALNWADNTLFSPMTLLARAV